MKKALIVVDYQYDFVAADGKLTAGQPARDILKLIAALAERYPEEDIYFTFDAHDESDWEGDVCPEAKAFPKHCIKGSQGYKIYGEIKGMNNTKNFIEKHAYCPVFDMLERLTDKYDEILVVGVVTDICVFQTVVGLYTAAVNKGRKLSLVVDESACASFNPAREKMCLDYMREVLSVRIESSSSVEK